MSGAKNLVGEVQVKTYLFQLFITKKRKISFATAESIPAQMIAVRPRFVSWKRILYDCIVWENLCWDT